MLKYWLDDLKNGDTGGTREIRYVCYRVTPIQTFGAHSKAIIDCPCKSWLERRQGFIRPSTFYRRWGNVGGIMTRLRSGRFGFRLPTGVREFFLFSLSSKPTVRPIQPTTQCLPGIERPGREADHLPSSADVKNGWNYTSTPPYAYVAGTGQLYCQFVSTTFRY